MVVIYSSPEDEEAARRVADVINDRVMYTKEFVLDSIDDKKIVLVGGEAVNPNVKYLVDNKYIPSLYDLRDYLGYEPCAIRYCRYNGKEIWIVAGWEKEHTLWTVTVIEYNMTLPVIDYIRFYGSHLDVVFTNVKYPYVVHFELYNMPVNLLVILKSKQYIYDVVDTAQKISNELEKKGLRTYTIRIPLVNNYADKIEIYGEVKYDKVRELYEYAKKGLAIPTFIWYAVAVFLVGAGIYLAFRNIKDIVLRYFDMKEAKIRAEQMAEFFDWCEKNNIPPEKCLEAWNYTLEAYKKIEEQRAKRPSWWEMLEMIPYLVTAALLISIISLFKR